MAMTKKERAEMDAVLREARMLGALRWTSPVARDVLPPKGGGYTEGWDFNAYSGSVWLGWSTSVSHGNGPAPADGAAYRSRGSQNSRAMYSSKALALAALRYDTERQAANNLAKIDAMIAAESGT